MESIKDLKKKGYIKENSNDQKIKITKKSELELRHSALDEIFGKLKKAKIEEISSLKIEKK